MRLIFNDDHFCRQLNALVKERSLSSSALTRILGISPSQLQSLLDGTARDIDANALLRCSDYFGIHIMDLLSPNPSGIDWSNYDGEEGYRRLCRDFLQGFPSPSDP